MTRFTTDTCKFGVRVAAIIIHKGYVLVHKADFEDFWTMPGGGVQLMEDAQTALIREMEEEIGVTVTVERLLYVVENLFQYQGSNWHEIGLYFLVHLPEGSPLLDKTRSFYGNEIELDNLRLTFEWVRLDDLNSRVILPPFLPERLPHLGAGIEHIVDRR